MVLEVFCGRDKLWRKVVDSVGWKEGLGCSGGGRKLQGKVVKRAYEVVPGQRRPVPY